MVYYFEHDPAVMRFVFCERAASWTIKVLQCVATTPFWCQAAAALVLLALCEHSTGVGAF